MFVTLSVIFWVFSFSSKILAGLSYDEDLARRLVHFSGAVYCIDDESIGGAYESLIFDWECETCDYIKDTSNIVSVYAFQDSSIFLDTEGLITYDDENDAITVVFAGTDPTEIVDVVTDLDLVRIEYDGGCAGTWFWEDDCTVHAGFYKSYKAVRSQVRSHVSDLLDDHPSATLEITGHSLGGALGILCALDLAEQGMPPDYVYTFGQPRVGDDEFVAYYNEIIGTDKTFRVTHRKDPVPLVPWTGWPWNYLHMGTEYYYPSDPDGSYGECDGTGEDSTCINQHNWWEVLTNAFIIADHLFYLDVSFTLAVVECNIGLDLNGNNGGDCVGNCTGNYTSGSNYTSGANRNQTIYKYNSTLDVLLNWTHYGSALWSSDDMNDGGIGEQWLIKWSLIEAAVNVNSYLADDDDIRVNILNATQVDNDTILVPMTISFEFDHQFNQFYCNLSYVIEHLNDNFKNLLGVDDTVEEALLHHYNEINNVDDNCVPESGNSEENDSSNSGDDGAVVRTLIIVAVGVFVVLIIGSFYYYKRNEYTKEKQKRKDNKDLSSKDQFNKATFNPHEHQASRVKSTTGSGTV